MPVILFMLIFSPAQLAQGFTTLLLLLAPHSSVKTMVVDRVKPAGWRSVNSILMFTLLSELEFHGELMNCEKQSASLDVDQLVVATRLLSLKMWS
jgi:hypothetical protein